MSADRQSTFSSWAMTFLVSTVGGPPAEAKKKKSQSSGVASLSWFSAFNSACVLLYSNFFQSWRQLILALPSSQAKRGTSNTSSPPPASTSRSMPIIVTTPSGYVVSQDVPILTGTSDATTEHKTTTMKSSPKDLNTVQKILLSDESSALPEPLSQGGESDDDKGDMDEAINGQGMLKVVDSQPTVAARVLHVLGFLVIYFSIIACLYVMSRMKKHQTGRLPQQRT